MDFDLQNQELTITDSRRRQFPREENGEGEPQSGEDNSEVQTYRVTSTGHGSQLHQHTQLTEHQSVTHGENSHPLREELPTKLLVRKASEN